MLLWIEIVQGKQEVVQGKQEVRGEREEDMLPGPDWDSGLCGELCTRSLGTPIIIILFYYY